MFTNSIRWRFQLWLAFLLICLLTGFGVTAFQLVRSNQNHEIYEQLQHRLSAVCGDLSADGRGRSPGPRAHSERGLFEDHRPRLRPPDNKECSTNPVSGELAFLPAPDGSPPPMHGEPPSVKLSTEALSLFDQSDSNAFYFAVWNRDGILRMQSSNAPADLKIVGRVERSSGPQVRAHGKYLESYLQHAIGYRVLVGRSIAPELAYRRQLALWLIAAGGIVLGVGLCGSWWLAGRALRPVQDISAAATRISAGNLAERINVVATDDELGRLAGVLNSTFAKLETAFQNQKQFTADASHELRTPLSVMISEAQTTLARKRGTDEYRETVETCLATAQQMRRLTESLLHLARFDAGEEKIHHQTLDLAEITRACVELVHPLAEERGIRIRSKLARAGAFGDADLLNRVIINLITNAIHYNKPKGEIQITAGVENHMAKLTVTDTGLGIAAADLPQIFERFYRADKSRSRSEGRSGLGLAICRAIVTAHGGDIQVRSTLGEGSEFTMFLPQIGDRPSSV